MKGQEDEEPRQSSLPPSLIPHLYSRPHTPTNGSPPTLPVPLGQDDFTLRFPLSSLYSLSSVAPSLPPTSSFESVRRAQAQHSFEDESPEPDNIYDPEADFRGHRSTSDQTLPPRYLVGPSTNLPGREPHLSTISSDPIFHRSVTHSQESSYARSAPSRTEPSFSRDPWGQNEAGPSSLHSDRGPRFNRGRRGSSQPARSGQSGSSSRAERLFDDVEHTRRDWSWRDSETEGYAGFERPTQHLNSPYGLHHSKSYQELSPRHNLHFGYQSIPGSFEPSYPVVPLRSRSTGTTQGEGLRATPSIVLPSYSPLHGEDDKVESETSRGKRQRSSSDGREENAKKRKITVACNFCRGRKLRCNGAKPTCSNCENRPEKCEYVLVPKRRGPGKAPKGSRSKKGLVRRSESSTSQAQGDPSAGSVDDRDIDAPAPGLRPQVPALSLERFTFHPQIVTPHHRPERVIRRGRRPYRRTSSEDRSDNDRSTTKTD